MYIEKEKWIKTHENRNTGPGRQTQRDNQKTVWTDADRV